MKIACLPLDSRPCNLDFLSELADHAGYRVLLPDTMDEYTRPSSYASSHDFLMKAGKKADGFVISVDHLCYGSLLASRNMGVSAQEALSRLNETVSALNSAFPGRPVSLFNTIIRSTISALRLTDLPVYRAMTAYAENLDRWEVTGDEACHAKAEEARGQIPEEILREYLQVRERNHAVNRACIRLCREGAAASLLLLMEDAQPYGFHRREQRILRRDMEGLRNVWLHNGTDEGGALCLARQMCPGGSTAEVRYLGGSNGLFTARYEDRPFQENLDSSMDYAQIRDTEGAEKLLLIAAPPDGIQEETDEHADADRLRAMAEETDRAVEAGRQVYLLDLIRANGGSRRFMELLRHPRKLWGYSAWNTAGNSLGTILAQILTDTAAARPCTAFRDERLLDDLIYESLIRPELNRQLMEEGKDPYHLENREDAEEKMRRLYSACPMALMRDMPGYEASLPWKRTFEVRIRMRGGHGIV